MYRKAKASIQIHHKAKDKITYSRKQELFKFLGDSLSPVVLMPITTVYNQHSEQTTPLKRFPVFYHPK